MVGFLWLLCFLVIVKNMFLRFGCFLMYCVVVVGSMCCSLLSVFCMMIWLWCRIVI